MSRYSKFNLYSWKTFFIALLIIFLVVRIYSYFTRTPVSPSSNHRKTIDLSHVHLSNTSGVTQSPNSAIFSLETDGATIYTAKASGLNAAKEFFNTAPLYHGAPLIPKNFEENSFLSKGIQDRNDPFLKKDNISNSSEHYFFQQTIQGIPVYGGQLIIHLRNNHEIYSVTGKLVQNQTIGKRTISNDKAIDIAIEEMKRRKKGNIIPHEESATEYILNKKLLDISSDEINHHTLAVTLSAGMNSERYFVDVTTGEIIYVTSLNHHTLSRKIYNCETEMIPQNAEPNCMKAGRSEGQANTGNAFVDSVYDELGTYYNFIFQNFSRNSLNGMGGTMIAQLYSDANAFWNSQTQKITIGKGLNDRIVTMHELTHGLTFYTAALMPGFTTTQDAQTGETYDIEIGETGALDEGLSDIFSMAINNVFVLKVGTRPPDRDAINPTSIQNPDKLFSQYWLCQKQTRPTTNGGGGDEAHADSNLFSRAFYLMAQGGNVSNCAITGIGVNNAIKIHYQMMTRYLNQNSNVLDYYNGMMSACNDLFKQGSSICRQVKAAMVVTEMDQQPAGSQDGPKCSGKQEKAIACPAQVTAQPTQAQPQPTTQTGGPNPTFTSIGDCMVNNNCPTTSPSSGVDQNPPPSDNPGSGNNGGGNGPVPPPPPSNGNVEGNGGLLAILIQLIVILLRLLF